MILGKMLVALFKRGKGLFKALFVIDDFLRIFTMTLLIPLGFSLLGLGKTFIVLGVLLGLVIDIHDFITSAENLEAIKAMKRR